MEDILKYCMKVNGAIAYYPIFDELSSKPLQPKRGSEKKYGWKNGKVSFVTEDGSYYITPYCLETVAALKEEGYVQEELYVPFANGDIPSDEEMAQKWENLCIEAKKHYKEKMEKEKEERCRQLAKEKGLKPLPEKAYQLSLFVPKEGFETTWMGQERSRTRPFSDWEIQECIGNYWQHDGRVSFVDDRGKMYVTPFWYDVSQMLFRAGYKVKGLYVPLSNGEKIIDKKTEEKWEQLIKAAEIADNDRIEKRKRKEKYKRIAEEKGLQQLPEEVYKISLEIPKDGLNTTWKGEPNDTILPVSEEMMPVLMGTFCQSLGRIMFIDTNGKTWISPFCWEVKQLLQTAGYKEGNMFVPLSNGEEITNQEIAEKWNSLCNQVRDTLNRHQEEIGTNFRM